MLSYLARVVLRDAITGYASLKLIPLTASLVFSNRKLNSFCKKGESNTDKVRNESYASYVISYCLA